MARTVQVTCHGADAAHLLSREENWTALLPTLGPAYSFSRYSATGLSSFEVMVAENSIHPQDLHLVDCFPPTVTPPATKAFPALVDRAAPHLEQAKFQKQAFVDAFRRDLEFSVGAGVWVPTRYMAQRVGAILAQRYIGPFRIIERIGKLALRATALKE